MEKCEKCNSGMLKTAIVEVLVGVAYRCATGLIAAVRGEESSSLVDLLAWRRWESLSEKEGYSCAR